jgi:hypothetical protein
MTVATLTPIRLELRCKSDGCSEFAAPLLEQLDGGDYGECSVLDLDLDLDEWGHWHRTARKRAARAERLGYLFGAYDRSRYLDDEFAINTSLERRQGRPMTAGYLERPTASDVFACPRHRVTAYGVFGDVLDDRFPLLAYAFIYRAGSLALVSQILGHGDYLRDDVMFLLVRGVIAAEVEAGGFLVYNRHDSGTDGLRFFKERIGFEPREVEWLA